MKTLFFAGAVITIVAALLCFGFAVACIPFTTPFSYVPIAGAVGVLAMVIGFHLGNDD